MAYHGKRKQDFPESSAKGGNAHEVRPPTTKYGCKEKQEGEVTYFALRIHEGMRAPLTPSFWSVQTLFN